LGVGVGLAEKLVSGTDDEIKDKLGRLAYAIAALKEVGTPRRAYRLEGPEGPITVHGVGIAVVNVGGIGDRIRFAPDGTVDDGLLDICVLRRLGAWDAVRLAGKALLGGLENDRAVDYYQWPHVQISTEGLLLQIDGESVDDITPVEIRVVPQALRVTVAITN
jgi:diacylglycerol kinase (ATP)